MFGVVNCSNIPTLGVFYMKILQECVGYITINIGFLMVNATLDCRKEAIVLVSCWGNMINWILGPVIDTTWVLAYGRSEV